MWQEAITLVLLEIITGSKALDASNGLWGLKKRQRSCYEPSLKIFLLNCHMADG